MTRLKLSERCPARSYWRQNAVVVAILLSAGLILRGSFDPVPVGADPDEGHVDVNALVASLSQPVELDSVTTILPCEDEETSDASENELSHAAPPEQSHSDRALLLENVELLRAGIDRLERTPDYTATFYKCEAIGGKMKGGQVMKMKLRHSPFSVYMKWISGDRGRELLYVDGENDGDMLVRVGGIRGRLLPPIRIDPHGSLAMRESRHPVTKVGLKNLALQIVSHREAELAKPAVEVRCRRLNGEVFDERPCTCFVLDYVHPEVRPPYRRSVQYLDNEYLLPVCIKNYRWPEETDDASATQPDESHLIEHYSYSGVRMNRQLADRDFDRTNANYRLIR